jgi:hypothetical protein
MNTTKSGAVCRTMIGNGHYQTLTLPSLHESEDAAIAAGVSRWGRHSLPKIKVIKTSVSEKDEVHT